MSVVLNNKTSNARVDAKRYMNLLGHCLPLAIETKEQYDHTIEQARKLLRKGGKKSREESELIKLLLVLIQSYEREHYPSWFEKIPPRKVLNNIMECHGHTPKDLWDVVADKGTISKILSGERAISKAQAKKLAAFYHVTPALFI